MPHNNMNAHSRNRNVSSSDDSSPVLHTIVNDGESFDAHNIQTTRPQYQKLEITSEAASSPPSQPYLKPRAKTVNTSANVKHNKNNKHNNNGQNGLNGKGESQTTGTTLSKETKLDSVSRSKTKTRFSSSTTTSSSEAETHANPSITKISTESSWKRIPVQSRLAATRTAVSAETAETADTLGHASVSTGSISGGVRGAYGAPDRGSNSHSNSHSNSSNVGYRIG